MNRTAKRIHEYADSKSISELVGLNVIISIIPEDKLTSTAVVRRSE